jgi:hypothetical protein
VAKADPGKIAKYGETIKASGMSQPDPERHEAVENIGGEA